MKKKVEKRQTESDPFKTSQRRKKTDPIPVKGELRSIGEKFTITASPEAWVKLHDKCFNSPESYQYTRRGGIFRDLWPFIQEACKEAAKMPPEENKRRFTKALQLQTAIIYGILKQEKNYKNRDTLIWKTRKPFLVVWKDEINKGRTPDDCRQGDAR